MAKKTGLWKVVRYLDDFLFVGAASSGQCEALLKGFLSLCSELGMPLAHDKTEGPATKITFLGVELDTAESSCLPGDKLAKLRKIIGKGMGARKRT